MTTRSLCILAAFLLSSSLVRADHPVIQARTTSGDTAIFIAAQSLFTPEGAFAAAVPSYWREQHVAYTKTASRGRARIASTSAMQQPPAAPCGGVYLAEADVESLVVRDSVRSTVRNAKAIYAGTIRTVTPGLFYGAPGSLLELGDLVTLKTTPAYANVRDSVLVRHPYAHFTAGTVEYCRETRAATLAPRIGDRVIVFAFADPLDEAGILVFSYLDDLIVARDGDVRIPRLLEIFGTRAPSVDQIAATIARTVADIDQEEQKGRVR